MRFFIDECVPISISKFLDFAGFEVTLLQEKTLPGSSDNLVAAVAEANNAILVTMDSDFKSIASRIGIGRARFRKLSLLRFEKCRESQATARLQQAMSLIEHEWERGGGLADRRMFVVITAETIRTHR